MGCIVLGDENEDDGEGERHGWERLQQVRPKKQDSLPHSSTLYD